MIRKSGYRFSLATNAECVCAEIMLNKLERRSGGRGGLGVGRGLGIHPHHLPDVAVGIFKTAAIHEAEILLRRRVGGAAHGFRLADHVVHGLAAVGGDADQDLARRARVGDPLRRELAELVRVSSMVWMVSEN